MDDAIKRRAQIMQLGFRFMQEMIKIRELAATLPMPLLDAYMEAIRTTPRTDAENAAQAEYMLEHLQALREYLLASAAIDATAQASGLLNGYSKDTVERLRAFGLAPGSDKPQ